MAKAVLTIQEALKKARARKNKNTGNKAGDNTKQGDK